MDSITIVALGVVGLGVAIPVVTGHRKGPVAALVLLAACGAVFLFDLVAVSTDLWDADGFVDCNDYCSTWQDAIGWSGLLSVALTLGLAVGLVVRAVLTRLRGMNATPPRPGR
jgi:hypothetical protein